MNIQIRLKFEGIINVASLPMDDFHKKIVKNCYKSKDFLKLIIPNNAVRKNTPPLILNRLTK